MPTKSKSNFSMPSRVSASKGAIQAEVAGDVGQVGEDAGEREA
jgi:hypothetical protein